MRPIEFWYEFASTYSYLAAMRIADVAVPQGIKVTWRPFLLGPILNAQGMNTSPFNIFPRKGAYMWRDVERRAMLYGLPFRRPEPFPQNSLLASRLCLLCEPHGCVEDFSRAVFHAEFAERAKIDDEAILRQILSDLGLGVEPMMAEARSGAVKEMLRVRTEEAERRGIFGAPSFVTPDGELFWGDDRMEQALSWASKA